MAIRQVLIDDIDETEDGTVQTVLFGFEGAQYEIDLNEKNRDALAEALTPFLNAARRAESVTRRRSATIARKSTTDTNAVREWAKANGMKVSERGRISNDVMEAYNAANK